MQHTDIFQIIMSVGGKEGTVVGEIVGIVEGDDVEGTSVGD